jgi:hypothetical protein
MPKTDLDIYMAHTLQVARLQTPEMKTKEVAQNSKNN